MSSSPRRAPAAAPADAPDAHKDAYKEDKNGSSGEQPPPRSEVRPFPYDRIPVGVRQSRFDGFGEIGATDAGAADTAAREARARSQGREEGQAEARQQLAAQLERERSSIAGALGEFARDRITYFHQVEGEVVQLALSIARRILHHEAQLDPMLLAGMVRVALEKIAGATGVRLRLHPKNAAEWRRSLASHLDPLRLPETRLPEIIEDPLQAVDSCMLETSMGTAVVGMEAELKEIEQGLTDLLAARPGNRDSSVPAGVQS